VLTLLIVGVVNDVVRVVAVEADAVVPVLVTAVLTVDGDSVVPVVGVVVLSVEHDMHKYTTSLAVTYSSCIYVDISTVNFNL